MKKYTMLGIITIMLFIGFAYAEEGITVQSDITFGYNILSNEDNQYFRNHYDFSEDFAIENFDFYLKNSNKSGWFDSFSIKARTGDVFDTGRKINVKLQKKGLYLFNVIETENTDYFVDYNYNYGGNNRHLKRNSIQADFKWFGFNNIDILTGFKQYQSTGNFSTPYYDWNNSFTLYNDKDISYDEMKLGFLFHKNNFKFAVNQSWISVDDNSSYLNFDSSSANNIILSNPTLTGSVTSDIPTTSVKSSYYSEHMAFSLSYTKKDGSIDNNSINMKNYFFEDFGSRTDKIVQLTGTSDNPTTEANFFFTFSPSKSFSISYDLIMSDTETDSSLNRVNTINLYGTNSTPIVTLSDSKDTSFFYKNKKTKHGATIKYAPIERVDFKVSYHKMDGELTNQLTENTILKQDDFDEYSSDKYQFDMDYRFSKGTFKVVYFTEDIEDPTYRVSGAEKDGYNISFNVMFSDKLMVNALYSDMNVKDKALETSLDVSNSLYDVLISYSLSSNFSCGIGTTGIKYENFIALSYFSNENLTNNVESYDFNQQGYYVFANYAGDKRLTANFSFYYMDDSGSSLPLSNLIGKAKIQIKLTKSVFGYLSGSYFDYSEDNSVIRDYNFNSLVIGFRWLVK